MQCGEHMGVSAGVFSSEAVKDGMGWIQNSFSLRKKSLVPVTDESALEISSLLWGGEN